MPAPSPGSPVQAARTSVAERAARIRFRRALSLMVMTLVVPGSAQLAAGGNRRVGLVALRTWVGMWLLVVVGAVAVAFDHGLALTLGSTPWFLLLLRLALLVGAVGWAFLFMDAWRLGQPLTLGLAHRRAAVGVNGVLCLSVAGALLFGAHVVGVQRDLMLTMFGSGQVTDAHHGRFNVLLLGGDSGAGRWGLRPDSLTVASIDEDTGRTVLVSLPRNMQNFPFAEGSVMAEQFPDGFDADYLNGVSTWAQDKDLVDAVGGITLNVRQAIPVGLPHDDFFHYIDPGTRKLSGFETLWYARARYDSDDYSRMARQKCVMNAMLQQVSPSVALRNFQAIAQASSELISTNVPASEVDTFLELALKAKSQKISTLSIVPPMVNTADPDIDLVHRKVTAAIEKAEGTAAPSNHRRSRRRASAVSRPRPHRRSRRRRATASTAG